MQEYLGTDGMRWLENHHPLRSATLKVLWAYLRAEVFGQILFGMGRECNTALGRLNDLVYSSGADCAFPSLSSFPPFP